MKTLGFEQCAVDSCVLRLIENETVSVIAVVHVDDIFAVRVGRKSRGDHFCENFNKLVRINNLGEFRWYAGCHFSRDMRNGLLTISQKAFTNKIVEKLGIVSNRTIPAVVGLKLEHFEKYEPEGDWPFREVVGSLMWLANQTRPDISNAVRAVARYAYAPKSVHWGAALSILKYLRTTSDLGIIFQRGSGLVLEVFADADYASKATDRRSVSGRVVMCGGAAVYWFSRTQKCVTLSTTEAEYVAMSECAKEALFMRHV